MLRYADKCIKAAILSTLLILVSGCSTGVIVHDQIRAGQLVIDFLNALKTDEGIELAYEWTDDRYKEQVSRAQFVRMIANLRVRNERADILLQGFETYGPVELITLFAMSKPERGDLYLRFDLYGTKTKDYYLLQFVSADTPFEHEGVYQDYNERIEISGV